MAKQEFLQLAHVYKTQAINGWFASEKLDGQRCFWDGGVTKGVYADEVPWANTARDSRLKKRPIATGLWSRYGKVIHAPDAWLAKLPLIPLDGELYLGRQSFQELRKIVADHEPGPGWDEVRFMVFDAPPAGIVFADRVINNTNFKKTLRGCYEYYCDKTKLLGCGTLIGFKTRYNIIKGLEGIVAHEQIELPLRNPEDYVEVLLDRIVDSGGEGLILKSPSSLYRTQRDHNLLKVKPVNDAEGIVIGFVSGKLSDNTRTVSGQGNSKLHGMIGSLIIETEGPKGKVIFHLSGLTDEERQWATAAGEEYAWDWPGNSSKLHNGKHFIIGQEITFKYREWSDDGVPKEARFFRK